MPNISLYQKFRTVDKNKLNKKSYWEPWLEKVHPEATCLPKLNVNLKVEFIMQKGFGTYHIENFSKDNEFTFECKYKDNDVLRYIIKGTITMMKYIYKQDWVIEAHADKVLSNFKVTVSFVLDNECNRGTIPHEDFIIEFEPMQKWEKFKRQIEDKFREVRRKKELKILSGINYYHRVKVKDTLAWKDFNELNRF